jgi:guanylate kinase
MRDDVVTVFVLPPSAQELKSRLIRRAEDSDSVITERLRNAAEEFLHWDEYDYILVNRDLDKSFARLRAVLTAERLKRVKMSNLESFVTNLLTDLKKITP